MKFKAFTLAEVLIALSIIGVVAAITIPTTIKKYRDAQTVTQVKKFYQNMTSAIQEVKAQDGCTTHISDCLQGGTSRDAFSLITRKLRTYKKVYKDENIQNVSWLPNTSTLLNGNAQASRWQSVSKLNSSTALTDFYMLSDGTTFMIYGPDSAKNYFIYFDVNGIKPPNRVGKDIFPMTVGGTHGSVRDKRYSDVTPFIVDDDADAHGGICVITGVNVSCNPDICTKTNCSPTAYVLKHGELPNINW